MSLGFVPPIHGNKGVHVPSGSRDWILPVSDPRFFGLRRLGLTFAGVHEVRRGFDWPGAGARTHLLIGCLAGEGFLETPEGQRLLRPGDLVLVPVGVSRRYFTQAPVWRILTFRLLGLPEWGRLAARGVRSFSRLWLNRLKTPVDGILAQEGPAEGVPSDTSSAKQTGQRPEEYIAERHGEQVGWGPEGLGPAGTVADPFQLYCAILQAQLEAMLSPAGDTREDSAIELASLWHRVREHPGRCWGTEDLAAALGVSRATLHRQVKRWHNASPGQIVEQIRMDEARQLLAKSAYPIQVIADQVGYASAFSFSAAFKRFVGESPSAFRARLR